MIHFLVDQFALSSSVPNILIIHMSYITRLDLLLMLLLVVKFSFFFYPQGPPRVSERVNHRQSARLGRTVKLPCPVEGDPPPLIMWTKDGRNIHRGWTRFRVSQHALRIKEVEMDDAGTYICKATNGFGSVNVNYTLIVIGKCFVHETSV